jgi:hypothetical protein
LERWTCGGVQGVDGEDGYVGEYRELVGRMDTSGSTGSCLGRWTCGGVQGVDGEDGYVGEYRELVRRMDTSGSTGSCLDDGHVEEYRELVGRMDMSASLYVQLLRGQTVVGQYNSMLDTSKQLLGCTDSRWGVQLFLGEFRQFGEGLYIQYS